MNLRPATQDDLEYVRANPFEDAVKNYHYMEVPDENCVAVEYEGVSVAVGGVYIRWPGVGLFWLMLTKDCQKDNAHGIRALCAIKEWIDNAIEENGIWRAEANIRPDFEKAIIMIEYLGFKRECTMEQYFPDKTDAFLYSKIIREVV